MFNARLDEAQAGIKLVGRKVNHLRYTYDTTLIAEREEELRSLLMKMKVSQFSHSAISDSLNCSTPGLPVHHQLLEFTQIHIH